jgi:hypothetical protein
MTVFSIVLLTLIATAILGVLCSTQGDIQVRAFAVNMVFALVGFSVLCTLTSDWRIQVAAFIMSLHFNAPKRKDTNG